MNNKELILHYFELSNAGDIESISELLDEHVSYSSDNVGLHFGK
jgi:ketosteroid isomerase-like protein